MKNWRNLIINDLKIVNTKITVVIDPDNLLREEVIIKEVQNLNFDIIYYNDPIAFRYIYESNYRQNWDNKTEDTSVKLLIVTSRSSEKIIPYDILSKSKILKYSLADLFPKLNNLIIQELNKDVFDPLFTAYKKYCKEKLTRDGTIEFILNYVYNLDNVELLKPISLLQWLFSRYYRQNDSFSKINPPNILISHIISKLNKNKYFKDWPINTILESKASFFSFLQKQWEIFLNTTEPCLVPFNENPIRVYIDNFFLEEYLKPINSENPKNLHDWVSVGICRDKEETQKRKFQHLFSLTKDHPTKESSAEDWIEFSRIWSEINYLLNKYNNKIEKKLKNIGEEVNSCFEKWLMKKYNTLHQLPYLPNPWILHHVTPYIASRQESKRQKIALIVLDGMSTINWELISRYILKNIDFIKLNDRRVFAFIPTITSISRQSIFAGTIPINFASYLESTRNENKLWLNFWKTEKGYKKFNIAYKTGLEDNIVERIKNIIDNPRLCILGLVINKIDEIAHGLNVGIKGMPENIKIWLNENHLIKLLSELLNNDFRIFITSDHGNTEAIGIGTPRQGDLIDQKYKRARIYIGKGASNFRKEASEEFPETIKWPIGSGLPKDMYILIPKAGYSFSRKKKKVVTHGGITLEEVIVPFVEVRRKNNEKI